MASNGKLSVNFAAIADFDNEYFQSAVLNIGYDSVIAYAVFPKFAQTRTLEGIPDAARVVQYCHPVIKKPQNALGYRRVELVQFPLRRRV
jgi:hypothetical protein